ncbi:MAG: glycoside hydrolase family 71/99-like protein [Verrucomicrobiota bacterium]
MMPNLRCCWAVLGLLAAAAPSRGADKTVMAYYMPWFTARPFRDEWGWHWTMGHFDPDRRSASGQREIASWYYPLIGPYDSSDPVVLEYHVLLMKLAGIDGVMVDWYGSADHLDYGVNNEATVRLFEFTRKAGLSFAICYEDQTIQHLIDDKNLAPGDAIAHAQGEMRYLQEHFFRDPSYLRLKGQPVLLNFGPQYFLASSNWDAIFSVLEPTNRPAFFTEDNRVPAGAGAFDWPPMWISQAPGTGGVLSGAALKTYLADFEQKASSWPAFVSSAFARFHDIYQRAGVRNYWGYLGDRGGDTFRETLSHSLTNSAPIVQLVTWNDFGEGTMVEPTEEFGCRDLGILQDFRRQYLQPGFSRGTNDLDLAIRLYRHRREAGTNAAMNAELDRVFSAAVTGELGEARRGLEKLR